MRSSRSWPVKLTDKGGLARSGQDETLVTVKLCMEVEMVKGQRTLAPVELSVGCTEWNSQSGR